MIQNKGFYFLHPDLLVSFLKSNCFKVKEEHLWTACIKWAQNIVDKGLKFKQKHEHLQNDDVFCYNAYNHNYNVWQKSMDMIPINNKELEANNGEEHNLLAMNLNL